VRCGRREKRSEDTEVKVIIVGCGRVGAELAKILDIDGHDVTVIDKDADAFNRLADDLNVTKVVGDGTDMETLVRSGIREADAFAAVTNGDNRNIMAAQIAQRMFEVPNVVCRIYDPLRQQTYKVLGLRSISPTVVGAKLLRNDLYNPDGRSATADRAIAAGDAVPLRNPQPGTPAKQ
jgi:trk system potassium uptake protein TrkA